MEPRRILLTGASGFVGRHLQPALKAAFPDSELLTPRFDVADADAVSEAIRDVAPDVCVHLAAIAAIPQARREPDLAWKVNLHGSLNIARALIAHAPACLMLYPSSADIYGSSFRSGQRLDETALLAPLNTYAATKAAAEMGLHALEAEGLRLIRVRPFNHTGPGQTADFVVSSFGRQIARIKAGQQEPMLQVGALDTYRDFLDVRDVCAAYVACIVRAETLPRDTVLNIASGQTRRIRDVLDDLIRLSGVTMWVNTDQSRLRPTDIVSACGNADRAHALLGWSPRIPFDQTLADILADWTTRTAA
jgi:GDP-4-dehydro-6-deoxy-D-mannose reductase